MYNNFIPLSPGFLSTSVLSIYQITAKNDSKKNHT